MNEIVRLGYIRESLTAVDMSCFQARIEEWGETSLDGGFSRDFGLGYVTERGAGLWDRERVRDKDASVAGM